MEEMQNEKNTMRAPSMTLPKSSILFVVMIAASVIIGGWFYIDIVRTDLQAQIDLLRGSRSSVVLKSSGMKSAKEPLLELYRSESQGFRVSVDKACGKNLSFSGPFSDERYEAKYGLSVVTDAWGKEGWRNYAVLTQEQYDAIPADVIPGKPKLLAVLEGGRLLAVEQLQGDPQGISGRDCEPVFERL